MAEKSVKFYLKKMIAGKNCYVWRLPSPPRRFIDYHNWKEDEPLEMKLTKTGLSIVPLKQEKSNGKS